MTTLIEKNLIKSIAFQFIFHKIAVGFHDEGLSKAKWMGFRHIRKRLLTLLLDVLKLRNFQTIVKDVATVDAHGCVYTSSMNYTSMVCSACRYTYQRGLLRCSFIQWWAMRRPQDVGRVIVQTLTLELNTII
jgi:hypothetical protein